MDHVENKRVVHDLCRGRPDAWANFVDQTAGVASAAVRKVFETHGLKAQDADVDEVVAFVYDSMIRANFRIFRRLQAPYDLRSLMVAAAMRRSVDALRAREEKVKTLGQEVKSEITLLPKEDSAGGQAKIVSDVIGTLSPRDAMLVRVVYIHGKSYREAASLVGMPLNGVGPTLSRALKKIRDAIAPEEAEP
jgi:RNA polymerase sigma factor (sigma-70 family)